MKRKDAVQKLKSILQEWENCKLDTKASRKILQRIEKEIGMTPPPVGGEMGQALTSVYMFPDYNQWDEDVLNDKAVVEVINRRAESRTKREARRAEWKLK